jgi:large subunit ribosomal protein L21
MYAVIQTGGKQHKVAPGDQISVEKLPYQAGERVVFDRVMMTSDGENISVGKPFLENTKVVGRVKRHGKGRKIVVFKFKRRKGYRKKQGHRQAQTFVKIENIEV